MNPYPIIHWNLNITSCLHPFVLESTQQITRRFLVNSTLEVSSQWNDCHKKFTSHHQQAAQKGTPKRHVVVSRPEPPANRWNLSKTRQCTLSLSRKLLYLFATILGVTSRTLACEVWRQLQWNHNNLIFMIKHWDLQQAGLLAHPQTLRVSTTPHPDGVRLHWQNLKLSEPTFQEESV